MMNWWKSFHQYFMEVASVICTSPPLLEETSSDKFKLHLRMCISISLHEFLLSYHLYELWTQCQFLLMTGRWSLHFNKLLYGKLNSQNTQFTQEKKLKHVIPVCLKHRWGNSPEKNPSHESALQTSTSFWRQREFHAADVCTRCNKNLQCR